MFLIQKGVLKEVHLDFMVSGHSFLPCDRGFGIIELACRKTEVINGPADYADIIRRIKNTRVHMLKQEEIFNIKSLKKRITMRTTKAKDYGFSKARTIILTEKKPYQFRLVQASGSVMVDLKKKGTTELISNEPIPKKYLHGEAIKVSDDKLKDLQHFSDFLNHGGRSWISQVVAGQTTAHQRPQIDQEHEVTPVENIQDDDQYLLDFAAVPPATEGFDLMAHQPDSDADLEDDMFHDEV